MPPTFCCVFWSWWLMRDVEVQLMFVLQGPMMLNVRRLTALTELRLVGRADLAGDVPVALLAANMPPDLAILQVFAKVAS